MKATMPQYTVVTHDGHLRCDTFDFALKQAYFDSRSTLLPVYVYAGTALVACVQAFTPSTEPALH